MNFYKIRQRGLWTSLYDFIDCFTQKYLLLKEWWYSRTVVLKTVVHVGEILSLLWCVEILFLSDCLTSTYFTCPSKFTIVLLRKWNTDLFDPRASAPTVSLLSSALIVERTKSTSQQFHFGVTFCNAVKTHCGSAWTRDSIVIITTHRGREAREGT